MPIHKQYGEALPLLNAVALEENIAEKIARLNRTTTARDLYDLNWIMETVSIMRVLNLDLIRRLAVLKIWVDSHGVHCNNFEWHQAHAGSIFDPEYWLRDRSEKEIDMEDIGTLAVPTPSVKELLTGIKKNYEFLNNLDETEKIIARSDERDRSIVLHALKNLPGNRLSKTILY